MTIQDHRINRRQFLSQAIAGAAAAAVAPEVLSAVEQIAATVPSGKRPNILVIMSDEHNAGVLGCYGNGIIKTANLDALAARGVVFENCYTPSPLCVPARQSFTAGKYASRAEAWDNSAKMPADTPSIAGIVNAAGYESVLCGKMHYDADVRYGFTEIGNSNMGLENSAPRRNPDNLNPKGGLNSRFEEFKTADTSSVIRHDQRVTAGTVEFLAKRKSDDKPFFFLAGYIAPHYPLTIPEKYYQAYKDRVPMPKMPAGHLESQPLNYRHERVGFNLQNVPPETVKLGRELYYGLTQWVDEQIGQILDALAKSPLAENTVVIYTSDHGENMGEHGLWWKNNMYDHAARVPLIVSYPKRWKGGQRRKGACGLLDVVQTIADVAGVKAPSDWNGTSLTGWLDDPATKWKDLAVSEYYAHNIASGFSMIRTGKWKHVYHTPPDANHPAERELYDMEADGGEFTNLAKDDKHKDLIAQLHAALVKEVGEEPDKTELRCREYLAKGIVRTSRPASQKAATTAVKPS